VNRKPLSNKDFATAKAFQRAFFDGETAYNWFQDSGREVVYEDVKSIEDGLPDTMSGVIGNKRVDNAPRLQVAKLFRLNMPVGKIAYMARPGAAEDVNVRVQAEAIMRFLKVASPPSSGEQKRNNPYRYRECFRYVIGDQAYITLPSSADFTVVGIANVAPHASTLENPGWARPYNRAWPTISKQAKGRYDVAFGYLGSSSLKMIRKGAYDHLGVGVYTPWGVFLRRSDVGQTGPRPYAVPIIWVGPLNSMSRTGKLYAKHRTKRRKKFAGGGKR
jgi:hypothetical protein